MLHLHHSNHLEALSQRLVHLLEEAAPGPFDAPQVIVPSTAMRRWLTLALARAHGICAHVAFDYLAPWLWRRTHQLLPGVGAQPPFAPAALAWRVYTGLADEAFVAAHPRLQAYLQASDEAMRFELATRIATQLEQTLTYRPDWIEAWTTGSPVFGPADPASAVEDERWQSDLWRRLRSQTGADETNTGAALLRALARANPQQARDAGLPAAVHVFALPTLPPLHADWLQQVARLLDVHLYLLNPCQEYWFDLVDRRRLSHLAARGQAAHHEEGHPLLAAWGRQTQAHLEAWVERGGELSVDDADFRESPPGTLLGALQNSILELSPLAPGSCAALAGDRSLEVHVCHSLSRELEVLHDHLLGLFARGEVSHPSQVLVVTPDLDAAAPLIEAVFGTAPRERHIAYSISGRARSTVNSPARALLDLLALAASRLPASAVYAFVQQDIVARRFGLDAPALQRVHGWLRDSGARWGLDAPHRGSFGVPATSDHTWADALERLYLGYALPDEVDEPFAERLPAGDAEGSEALALGAFWQFLARLRDWRAAAAKPHTPAGWRALLLEAVDGFTCAVGDELDDQRELLAGLGELCETMQAGGLAEPNAPALPLAVVRAALERHLDDPARGGVPTGAVTFTSMHSLRGLPFEVVCAIGLDDGAFPTTQRPLEFDLLAHQPRRGDRQRRADERNLFLDLLLAARRSVYLSYTGRSVRDNSPMPPSVLVSELLERLLPAAADDPASAAGLERARRRLVVEHPLQPFSLAAFEPAGDPRQRSFNRELAEALRTNLRAGSGAADAGAAPGSQEAAGTGTGTGDAGAEDEAAEDVRQEAGQEAGQVGEEDGGGDDEAPAHDPQPPFFAGPLAAPGPEWRVVSMEQLVSFLDNPSRFLLKERLGLELGRSEKELQDDEPFLPDWSARQALAERLLPRLLAGAGLEAVRPLAQAGAEWPSGPLAGLQLDGELQSLADFAARVRADAASPALAPHSMRLTFEIEGETWSLAGSFADLRPEGLVRWRYGDRRAGDVLRAWVAHLALCASAPAGVVPCTVWHFADGPMRLGAPPQPHERLHELLQLYRRGLREPLAFFPRSAWAYVQGRCSLSAAYGAWRATKWQPGAEGGDAAHRLAWRGRGDPLLGEFGAIAERVFGPVQTAEVS